jgi:ABC-type transport system involved in multi-copper enzyme maturation permease subunit
MGLASVIGDEIGRRTGIRPWLFRKVAGAARAARHLVASPIVTIELAAAFRRKRFLVAFTLALLVVVAILIAVIAANVGSRVDQIGRAIFLSFSITIGAVIAILFPAFSCASLVEERLNKSLDLLLVTKLEPWEIFTGKLSASLVYCAMYLTGTLPVVGLSFLFGGVEPGAIVVAYAQALLAALLVCVIGTYASATAGTFIRAIVTSYLLSWLMNAICGAAFTMITGYWVLQSWGLASSSDLSSLEKTFADAGDLIYGGAAFVYIAVVLFFFLAGANRLKPVSYDRSTSMRAFALFALGGGALLDAAIQQRVVDLAGDAGKVGGDYATTIWLRIALAAGLLFIPVLVFSTERTELSRRVKLELAARFRLSPMRLLAPGPARGAIFSLLLASAVLLGMAWHSTRGLGVAAANAYPRGELALRDLALVLLAFLAFLAAFGRLLAEHASGTVAPRLALAGLAVVLCLGPILAYVAEDEADARPAVTQKRRRSPPPAMATPDGGAPAAAPVVTETAEAEGVPSSIARGYVLSPILAGMSALAPPTVDHERPKFFVLPSAFTATAAEIGTPRGATYSASFVAAQEARAVPLHRATTALYGALAASLWFWGAARARRRARADVATAIPG